MKNNYLISGIPITDTDQGKVVLDISLEDVKFSEDHSDIIAGKVTAQATGYTNDEEINPLVLEGSDVSLTGAGSGGIPTATVHFTITNNGSPIQETVLETATQAEETSSDGAYINMQYRHAVIDSAYELLLLGEAEITQISFFTEDNLYIWGTAHSCTVISGDARIDDDSHLYINGDCELLLDTDLD